MRERTSESRAANSRVSISGGTARSRKSSSTLWRGHSVDDGDDEYTHRRYLAPSRVLPSFSLVFSHILPVDKTAVYHPLSSPPWAFSPIVLLSVRVSNNAWATLAPFFRRTPSHTHAGRKHLLRYITPLAGPLASPAHSLAASIYLLVSGNRRPSRRFSLPSSTPTPVVTRDRLAGLTRREVRFFLNVRTGTRSITNDVFPWANMDSAARNRREGTALFRVEESRESCWLCNNYTV